ncbi:protein-serine/threonine phosphatase [Salvia divinorum]|uniref:protein-serine/threonine phosphatase n=1 Tax=Salvia divinorum TaxID=28513 RepID=A0ABD1HBN3_SALDI
MADVAGSQSYYKKSVDSAAARRRRRNQLRRKRRSPEEGEALPTDQEEEEDDDDEGRDLAPGTEAAVVARRKAVPVPDPGAVAVAGRQRTMEDAVTVWMDLCSPLITGCLPVHYFAIYDGHGGSHFSTVCRQKMHEIFKEELMGEADDPPPAPAPPGFAVDEGLLKEAWRVLISRVFARTETVALDTCSCGSEGFECGCDRDSISYSGTTAVAALMTDHHIVVGNCGDSRAVLYRAGHVVPLSFDHKPGRADEKARIQASGGQVVNTDTERVDGILAMSRAIGDVFLKPSVISEPDMTLTKRIHDEDEFVIVASDGMWDVIPMEMAGRVARHCLSEPPGSGARLSEYEVMTNTEALSSRSACAASVLTRLALARSSVDNISIVVIDLKGMSVGDEH